MAELKTKSRKKLPDNAFAGPGRSYPVPDSKHAITANARASQQVRRQSLEVTGGKDLREGEQGD